MSDEKMMVLMGGSIDPHYNLAIEEMLMGSTTEGEIIFRLWQNSDSVIIGKNQNPYFECDTDLMRRKGVHLVRRLSGGGAVFHDLGNLNFSFYCRAKNYDYNRQVGCILKGLAAIGIKAELSGRNDICVDGKKISGNSFCSFGDVRCHHGTILVETDFSKMNKYLTPCNAKLEGKNIDSVRSRVVNLNEIKPDIKVSQVGTSILEALRAEYGRPVGIEIDMSLFGGDKLNNLTQKYSSPEWILTSPFSFSAEKEYKTQDGTIRLLFKIDKDGKIAGCRAYSDYMEVDFIDAVPYALMGRIFGSEGIKQGIMEAGLKTGKEENAKKLADTIED